MAHTYETHLVWEGSTGEGYREYSRSAQALAPPSRVELPLSADPAFRGDPARLNPEQLLVMALSSCQLLSFLAVAARQGVDVRSYEDEAVGSMSTTEKPMRITEVALSPQILVAPGTDTELVERLVHEAHQSCFIANSVTTAVTITPTITVDNA